MVHRITSLGKGRRFNWIRAQVWAIHMLGGAVGGGASWTAIWLLASPVRSFVPHVGRVGIAVAIALAGAAGDAGLIRRLLPSRHKQVPVKWYKRYGPRKSYLLYGMVLGTGFLTHAPHAAPIAVLALSSLIDPPLPAAFAGMIYGLSRAFAVGPGVLAGRFSLAERLVTMSRVSSKASFVVCAAIGVLALT